MEEIEGLDNKGDEEDTIDGRRFKWMTEGHRIKPNSSTDGDDNDIYMEHSTLEVWQNTFVRFKGYYEGAYKGFYRNQSMELAPSIEQCLTDESYESLDMIALAIDETENGNFSMDMMGFTALVHLYLDNEKNCNFDKILLDATSFCFINNCALDKLIGNLAQNWAESIFAFSMMWSTIFS
jgi:hypothetical protein